MKKTVGLLLWLAGYVVNVLTVFAAIVYLFGVVAWMHAPLLGALGMTAAMAVLPLTLAWACRTAGKRLRKRHPAVAPPPSNR